jgi:hypothetical protein
VTNDRELERRTHRFRLPPSGFDPLTASDRQLEEYGLPARPERNKAAAVEFWTMLMSQPLRFVEPQFQHVMPRLPTVAFSTGGGGPATASSRPAFAGRGHIETSRNWSGLYLQTAPSERFTSIYGAWRVPAPRIPQISPIDPGPADPFHNEYRSSIWVGLDGHRVYPQVTMPQIGTWQYIKPTAGHNEVDLAAWWQWWTRDEITPTVRFANFPIAVGDHILASVVVVSADEVVFYIKNQTTGLFAWVLVQAPARSEPLGSTAEWVVERPTWPFSIWPSRMPDLGIVDFSQCFALSGPRIIGPQKLNGLQHARLIRMQERFEHPYRSALISIPERLSPTSARVRYREAHVGTA